jgi:hypothetical protein
MEESNRAVIEILSLLLPGGTEENQAKLQSGYLMSQRKFDPNTYKYNVSLTQPAKYCSMCP